jgi:hypothetical protein
MYCINEVEEADNWFKNALKIYFYDVVKCFQGLYQELSIYFNKSFFFRSKNTPTPTF